jgi:hypothetical protein
MAVEPRGATLRLLLAAAAGTKPWRFPTERPSAVVAFDGDGMISVELNVISSCTTDSASGLQVIAAALSGAGLSPRMQSVAQEPDIHLLYSRSNRSCQSPQRSVGAPTPLHKDGKLRREVSWQWRTVAMLRHLDNDLQQGAGLSGQAIRTPFV